MNYSVGGNLMDMQEIIKNVNYYAKLIKERALTEEETADRDKFRKMYLAQFKAQVKDHLDNIKIVDENDSKSIN